MQYIVAFVLCCIIGFWIWNTINKIIEGANDDK
jgi:hypothetical protein